MPDLVPGRVRVRLDERRRGHDLPRRAKAALQCVRADEGVDERVVPKSLDRRHLALADGVNERDAGVDRHAVELNGARAAVAFAARDLRSGESEVEPQRLRERLADGRIDAVNRAIDVQLKQPTAPGIPEELSSERRPLRRLRYLSGNRQR